MNKKSMELIKIRNVLTYPEKNPEGWLCLPPDSEEWSLDTLGIFSLDSVDFPPDSEEWLPIQVKEDGWVEVLDDGGIEEVVGNMEAQLSNPTLDQLLQALIYYYENDAFINSY